MTSQQSCRYRQCLTHCSTVYSRFPDSHFPGKMFPGWSFSRMRQFLMINLQACTPNMNNTIYIFIPRRKANWLAFLTPHGYAKCQMLIFHHSSSKTNELRNVQGSIKTASVSTFLSWPSVINYRYSVWSLWQQLVTCYNAVNQLAPLKLNRLNWSNAMTMSTATSY